MSEAQVMALFVAAYRKAGSYRALGKRWGFSAAYLHDVHRGRRTFSAQLLRHLGVTVEVVITTTRTYRRIKSAQLRADAVDEAIRRALSGLPQPTPEPTEEAFAAAVESFYVEHGGAGLRLAVRAAFRAQFGSPPSPPTPGDSA